MTSTAVTQVRRPPRRPIEREFLPAALEILETPASPVGRSIALVICLFFAVAIAWAWFGRVDTVAVAQGRVIPSGHTKVIQPLDAGVVRAIHVQDGDRVRAGDTLLELDPTAVEADRERLTRELMTARLAIMRLQALLGDNEPPGASSDLVGLDPAVVHTQQSLYLSQLTEYRKQLAALDQEKERQLANAQAIDAGIKKLKKTVPLIQERVNARKTLLEKGLAPRTEYLLLQEQLVTAQQDLAIAKARAAEAKAGLAGLDEQREQVQAQFRRDRLSELAEAETRRTALEQELVKATERANLQRLVAPVDGIVQQLSIHTLGGVVTPAQRLMVIVPENSQLEIEARVLNKDIGFVRPGQEAVIKLDSFPFTRYGTIPATVSHVSTDSIQDERGALVYTASISPDRATIDVDGRQVRLAPGMSLVAEIKSGQRRVLEFLFDPILRYRDESMQER